MKGWGREKEGNEKKQNRGKLEKQGDGKET